MQDLGDLKTCFCGYFEEKSNSNVSKKTSAIAEHGTGTSVLKNNNSNDADYNLSAERRGCIAKGNIIKWIFCQVCLHALSCLKNTLQAMKNLDNAGKGPVVDLSINDQQVVKTVIQLVVVVGICPNFVKGVGIPIEQRTGFSGALGTRQDTKCPKCFCKCVMSLVSCLTEPSLSLVILSKHLADILAALMQLGYCQEVCHKRTDHMPSVTNEVTGSISICEGGVLISKAQQDECKKALNNLVSKMYQPLIIRELLFLQGSMSGQRLNPKECVTGTAVDKRSTTRMSKQKEFGELGKACEEREDDTRTPGWMKDVCGHLLSKCLMKKNGVQSVLRAVLEGVSGGASEWKVCEAIAQVISNCPLQIQSPEEYYRSISPQVLTLLQLPSSKLQQQYSRAPVLIIHAMLRKYPEIASKYIAHPLMQPFLIATEGPGKDSKTVLVNEKEMTRCIEALHKVFVASPNSSPVLTKNMEKIVVAVFELFCFARRGATHVKTAVLELLSTFFKRTSSFTAMTALYVFICQELPDSKSKRSFLQSEALTENSNAAEERSDVHVMAKRCCFGHGETGGVVLQKVNPSTTVNEKPLEEMFGKEGEICETRALCLVEVLENLRKDDVPGNFFLYLLQQVQDIILKPNFRENEKMRTLVIFNALALMCEKLGPSVLKNTGHMIQFIETTLTRAHHVYTESTSETGLFEMETLTMALGMLSALLGGAVKLESSDYEKLQILTPILREIAENHEQEEIMEQANDLLVLILTQTTVLMGMRNDKGKPVLNTDTNGSKWIPEDEQNVDLDFDKAMELLFDPLLPVRGHALIRLSSLLKSRDPKALEKVDILVKTFRDCLIHEDSYIYLASVEGLVAAADVRTDDVIPYLAREFVACCTEGTGVTECKEDNREYEELTKGKETKIGIVKRSSTTRLKLGEALVRAVKRCGELAPRYFQLLIHAFLVGARDEDSFIRASSLSNLSELCGCSPHMLATVIHEVFHCIDTILRSEKEKEVRQAAVLVLTFVLKRLGQNAVAVLSSKLKDIYELLKFVESNDMDESLRIHAQVALEELDAIMREQLFPEQKFVKHIKILP